MNADQPVVDVLVVDDDAAVRTSTGEIIASSGYSVIEAADGQEALDLLGQIVVGIMLLDIQMPRLNGLALLDRLEDPPPTVLLSAIESYERPEHRESKIVRHMHKPATPNDLLLTIATAIGPPRSSNGR
jgi:CheY-like chemotaxis protein